jgi:TorA maturation chaperone TorD
MQTTLRAYQVILGLSGQLFRQIPTAETLGTLVGLHSLLDDEPFCTFAPGPARSLYETLEEAAASEQKCKALLANIRRDYTALFLVPGDSHVSPYESIYRNEDHSMCGPTEAEVRKLYKHFDMQPAQAASEPADNFGQELVFASMLLSTGSEEAMDALRQLLRDHLLTFAPGLLRVVADKAATPFYRNMSRLTAATLTRLQHDINTPSLVCN